MEGPFLFLAIGLIVFVGIWLVGLCCAYIEETCCHNKEDYNRTPISMPITIM